MARPENIGEWRKFVRYCPHFPIKLPGEDANGKKLIEDDGKNGTDGTDGTDLRYLPGLWLRGLYAAPIRAMAHLEWFGIIWKNWGYLAFFGIERHGGWRAEPAGGEDGGLRMAETSKGVSRFPIKRKSRQFPIVIGNF